MQQIHKKPATGSRNAQLTGFNTLNNIQKIEANKDILVSQSHRKSSIYSNNSNSFRGTQDNTQMNFRKADPKMTYGGGERQSQTIKQMTGHQTYKKHNSSISSNNSKSKPIAGNPNKKQMIEMLLSKKEVNKLITNQNIIHKK